MTSKTSGEILALNGREGRETDVRSAHASKKTRLSTRQIKEKTNTFKSYDSGSLASDLNVNIRTYCRNTTRSTPETPSTLRSTPSVSIDLPLTETLLMVQKCYDCDFESTSTSLLVFHQVSKHDPGILIFRCSDCREKFLAEAELEEHCRDCGIDSGSKETHHECSADSHIRHKLRNDSGEQSAVSRTEHVASRKMYRCTLCHFETPYAFNLVEHRKRTHHLDGEGNLLPKLKCSQCDYSTFTDACLRKHKQRMHTANKTAQEQLHRCNFCWLRFASEESLDEHLTDHPKYKCSLCDFESPYTSNLIGHRKRAHHIDAKGNPISEMKCTKCDYSTFINAHFIRHLQERHSTSQLTRKIHLMDTDTVSSSRSRTGSTREMPNPPPSTETPLMVQKCYSCDFESNSIARLTLHQASKHDPGILIYRCSSCRVKFVTEAEMDDHCQHCDVETSAEPRILNQNAGISCHDSEELPRAQLFKCRFCSRKFQLKERCNEHMSDHPKRKCTLCEYQTPYTSLIYEHRKRVHRIDGKGNPICERESTKSGLLRCKFCLRKFRSKESCDEHMINHPKNRCNLCDFETPYSSSISEHRRRVHHIDGKGNPISALKYSGNGTGNEAAKTDSLVCKFCLHSFPSKESRDEHMINHPTLRCSLCEYETPYTSAFNKHQKRSHHIDGKGKPASELKCPECHYTTFVNARFRSHMQEKHPNSQEASTSEPLKCKRCCLTFKTEESRTEHMSTHPKYECSLCDYESLNQTGIMEHRKCVHHVDAEGNPISEIKCSECKYTSFSDSRLKQHKRSHKKMLT